MKIQALFDQFRKQTDDTSAAILTLASILQGDQADKPLTVKQAASRLGVSPETIYSLVESKKLRHQRVGRAIRIYPADLQWIA